MILFLLDQYQLANFSWFGVAFNFQCLILSSFEVV